MAYTNAKPASCDGGPRQIGYPGRETAALNSKRTGARQVLRATLTGATTASAAGETAHGSAPVLSLCKTLLANGMTPDAALLVYRNGVLALKVRSIAEAASLEISADPPGFRRLRQPHAGPPMRQNGGGL